MEIKIFQLMNCQCRKRKREKPVAKILSASICGTDLRTYRFGNPKLKTPITIGHEACYQIVEVGSGVDLAPGDRYVIAPAIGLRPLQKLPQRADEHVR